MIDAPSLRCGAAACTVKNTEVMLVLMTKCSERGASDRRVTGEAGIGKDNVEFAELVDGLIDGPLGRRDIGRVGHDRQRVWPQFLRGDLKRRLIAPGDGDPCAFGHE